MMELIERLINKNKPFLIIKYGVVFSDMANNCYELVTIDHNHRLHFAPIERQVAVKQFIDLGYHFCTKWINVI